MALSTSFAIYSAIASPRDELRTAKHRPFGVASYAIIAPSAKRVGKIETKILLVCVVGRRAMEKELREV